MEFKYNKLRGRIVEKFGSQNAFAKHIGVSHITISNKLHGNIGFSQADIMKWAEALEIKLEEIGIYFFT